MMMSHGANLVPEGLETGEMQIDGTASFDELKPAFGIAYSNNPNVWSDPEDTDHASRMNGIITGVFFSFGNGRGIVSRLNSLYAVNPDFGSPSDYIISVFSLPALALDGLLNHDIDFFSADDTYSNAVDVTPTDLTNLSFKAPTLSKTLTSRPSNIDGYTPRNKKLLTYPYCYLGFNPANGTSKVYRYEDFSNGTPSFNIYSEINPNPTVYFIPQNYRGQSGNSLSDSCSMNGYPTCGYSNDAFNSWLAQNSGIISLNLEREQFNYEINQERNLLNGISSGINNATNLNIGSTLTSGIDTSMNLLQNQGNYDYTIKNQMAQIEKQSLLPNSSTLSSSNATLLGYDLFDNNIFTRYTIKSQFAEKIDSYFDMFGYLTNEVKIPNLNNRSNWNYVKTIGAIITGDIPQTDLQQIKNMFDNGITLWHNSNTFLDYSQSNN